MIDKIIDTSSFFLFMVALETDALGSIYYGYNEVDDLIGFRISIDEYNFSDYYYIKNKIVNDRFDKYRLK